jgi:hypothetical protein
MNNRLIFHKNQQAARSGQRLTEFISDGFHNSIEEQDCVRRLARTFKLTRYTKCLFKNARPDPPFKYLSNSNALYLSENAM